MYTVQLMVHFFQLSKHLIIRHVSSICLSMCSSMNCRERLFCTIALFPGTKGRVLHSSFVQSQIVWLYIKSVKLNAVVWKRVALKFHVYAQSLQFIGCRA